MSAHKPVFNPRRMWLAATAVPVCAGVLLLGAASGTAPRAHGAHAQAAVAGVSAKVRVEAVGTQSGGPTKPSSSWGRELAVGQTLVAYFAAFDSEAGACPPDAGPRPSPDAALLWRIEATLLEASPEETRLRVHWTRNVRNTNGPDVQKDETTDVRLGRTDYRILDYQDLQASGKSRCASALIRITAEPRVPIDLARTAMVDLWTVEETAGRAVRSVHERIEGAIGEPMAFQMFSLDYPVTATEGTSDPAPPAVELSLGGTLLLLPAGDGTFQASANVSRRFLFGGLSVGGQGRQLFTAREGRTVALVVPPLLGSVAAPVAFAGPFIEGVSRRDGTVQVDLGKLLAGHQISLYVKIAGIR